MIQDKNQTAHVYDENDAKIIFDRIRAIYLQLFEITVVILNYSESQS